MHKLLVRRRRSFSFPILVGGEEGKHQGKVKGRRRQIVVARGVLYLIVALLVSFIGGATIFNWWSVKGGDSAAGK